MAPSDALIVVPELAGRYRVLPVPPVEGGMASVYRAVDEAGTYFAIKVLHQTDAATIARFRAEASLLASLAHPAIVRYVEHGVSAQAGPYLVMEWLEGETLEDRLPRGRISLLATLRLGRRVLDGLALAHRKGIVHRDIKPTNLFLPAGDLHQVKILDFGIARRAADSRLTAAGGMVGTALYMSPEQIRGSDDIDGRSDVFSLGSVLFECLIGTPAFEAETPVHVIARILNGDPPVVEESRSDVPPALAAAIGSMLRRSPDERPTAADLAASFAELQAGLQKLGYDTRDQARPFSPSQELLTTEGLGADEERLTAGVLVSRTTEGLRRLSTRGASTWDVPSAITRQLPALDDTGLLATAQKVAEAYGGEADAGPGGMAVVTLRGEGNTPTELAIQAARCALAIKGALPGATLAVVLVRGSDVAAGGVSTLLGARDGTIGTNGTATGLLQATFELDGAGAVLFEKGAREAPRTVLGKKIPCLGRDRELGYLEGTWTECTADSVARPIVVIAGAGGGKTRVRLEFLDRIRKTGAPFGYLSARADVFRGMAPFALLGAALRAAAGITGGEAPELQRRRLTSHVQRHVRREAPTITAFIGEICGVRFPDEELPGLRAARQDARLMADRMVTAWLDFLDAELAAGPVLIVFEDLHWGDQSSVQFVDAALRSFTDRPLMVAAFARSEELQDRFPGLWSARSAQIVDLKPLSPKAAAKLAQEILGEIPPARLNWIVDRAQGNPFHLEELLRVAAEGGAGDDAGLQVPDSIIAMVQARFDSLGQEAKRVLRAAAIYGETFLADGVRALIPDEARDIDRWLEILGKREIVYSRQAGERREYVFRHATLRDAAYSMLTPADRRAGHRLAGLHLEGRGERDAILLVEHLERGGEDARAARWCQVASQQALDANDLAAAIDRVERGVRLGAEDAVLATLHLIEAQARYWRAEYPDAERAAREAAESLEGDQKLAALAELAAALGQQTKFTELLPLLALLESADPGEENCDNWLAAVFRCVGFTFPAGRSDLAQRLIDRTKSRAAVRLRFAGPLHATQGRLVYANGSLAAALDHWQQAVVSFEAIGDLRSTLEYRMNLAGLMADLGRLDEAAQGLEATLRVAERLGLPSLVLLCAANALMVEFYRARGPAAAEYARRARELARAQGDTRQLAFVELYRARMAISQGNPSGAEEHAREAVRLYQQVPRMVSSATAAVAAALLAQSRAAEAVTVAREAVQLLEERGAPEDGEVFVRLTLAEALIGAGEDASAAVRAAAACVTGKARSIDDEASRRAFLEGLPDNARVVLLAGGLEQDRTRPS